MIPQSLFLPSYMRTYLGLSFVIIFRAFGLLVVKREKCHKVYLRKSNPHLSYHLTKDFDVRPLRLAGVGVCEKEQNRVEMFKVTQSAY